VREGDQGEAKLAEVTRWRDSELFTEPERVALEYAERMTRTGERVDDVLSERLQRHYSEAQIVELTAAIAFENFRSKFNPALGVEVQGFCLLTRGSKT
jgi:alkylhydroperoxidase family enzyme